MHVLHSGSVPTLVLALLRLVRSGNIYGMCTTCVEHRFLKLKVVVRNKNEAKHELHALEHVYITVCSISHAWQAFR